MDPGIKSMALYRNVERIISDLAADGLGPDAPLAVDDLVAYDQFHYEGTTAVAEAAELLDISSDSEVLDIGSGLGGPARFVADRVGCRVTALELQPDVHDAARGLTARTPVAARVHHHNGDILADPLPAGSFDAAMSMLCFLHIPDRARLFASCRRVLRPSGRLFIDDYYAGPDLTDAERDVLAHRLYCRHLPDLDTYRSDLDSAGFTIDHDVDMTDRWTRFVNQRLEQFREHRDTLAARYGTTTVDSLDEFYEVVVRLFTRGAIGGARFVVSAPAGPEQA